MTERPATEGKDVIPLVTKIKKGPETWEEFCVLSSAPRTSSVGNDWTWLAPLAEEEDDVESLCEHMAHPVIQPEAGQQV